MIFCIDFDGTCVTHDFPEIGKDIGAVPILKALAAKDHQLILWTMRSTPPSPVQLGPWDEYRDTLAEAVAWFDEHGIPLFGINENPVQTTTAWSTSPKAYAQIYIDDAALGCPLKTDTQISNRPFVDWKAVEEMLIERGII